MERSQQEQEQLQHDDSYRLPMPMSAGATLVRKFGSLLGGGKEGSVRHSTAKRGSIFTGGFSPRPSGEVLDSENYHCRCHCHLNGLGRLALWKKVEVRKYAPLVRNL